MSRRREIHFVIGPPGSGKSTYIANRFKGFICVDIWGYQEGVIATRDVWRSYATHRRDCINIAKAIKGDFVIEHTLLKAKRRKYYIDKLKSFGSLWCHYTTAKGFYAAANFVYEYPTLVEGFDRLVEIKREVIV